MYPLGPCCHMGNWRIALLMLLWLSLLSRLHRDDQGNLSTLNTRRVSQLGYSLTFLDENDYIQAYIHDGLPYTAILRILNELSFEEVISMHGISMKGSSASIAWRRIMKTRAREMAIGWSYTCDNQLPSSANPWRRFSSLFLRRISWMEGKPLTNAGAHMEMAD